MILTPQLPYSPDAAPCDCFPFPRKKETMKHQRFETIDEMKQKSLRELCGVEESAFQKCFNDWKTRRQKCIVPKQDYFEGDTVNLDE